MRLSTLLLSGLLGLAANAVLADPPAAGTTSPAAAASHGGCKANPQKCAQLAQQFDDWCAANADKCTKLKAHIEKRREWCEQNQDKCKAMRERMRARMQQRCQTNPDAPHCQNKQGAADGGNDDDDDTGG